MISPKIKLLFVTKTFYQAGAERFLYELDSVIDRAVFDVSVMVVESLNKSKRWKDYYFEKHKALGDAIYFYEELSAKIQPTLEERLLFHVARKPLPDEDRRLKLFLDSFDVISFIGENNFIGLKKYITQSIWNKSVIHILNSVHQSRNLYVNYDKQKHYLFCSGFDNDELKIELDGFANYEHHYIPLSIKVDSKDRVWKFKPSGKRKIGIFTRLTSHKPLDPFFYALQLLLDKIADVELHIYGSGNPEEEGMMNYVKRLGLESKVFFRGHQEDMKQTAIKDEIDLVWFHGYYGQPGGFASFDLTTIGIPQIFWDFSNSHNPKFSEVYPMYNHLSTFVEKSLEILNDGGKASQLSDLQYDSLLKVNNVECSAPKMEQIWKTIAQRNN
jgi:glycosyltransferase involved in cell wall biosynthesis